MPYPADAVAAHFIHRSLLDGSPVDPLKLQKLIYFANGVHLAAQGPPLINEPIRAWKYGPVVEPVYHLYKQYGAGPITEPYRASAAIPPSDKETRDLLEDVWQVYGKYSGVQLSTLSHDPSGPWAKRMASGLGGGFGPTMKNDDMRAYFERFVKDPADN